MDCGEVDKQRQAGEVPYVKRSGLHFFVNHPLQHIVLCGHCVRIGLYHRINSRVSHWLLSPAGTASFHLVQTLVDLILKIIDAHVDTLVEIGE